MHNFPSLSTKRDILQENFPKLDVCDTKVATCRHPVRRADQDEIKRSLCPPKFDNFPLKSATATSRCHLLKPKHNSVLCDSAASPIELCISNLDYNISAKEWKQILYAELSQYVQVITV